MFIRLFYFFLYMFILVNCKIEIKDANVAALSRDEIGMIFYITVQNTNFCPYEVKVNMIECTEVLTPKDRDANFMYLIGGHMGVLRQHCFKNLTVIYPNMYLHNRRGYCLISIKFKSEQDELIQKKANITFDTYITKRGGPYVMRGYYNKAELSKCHTIDQDPLNRCSPVDCHMKYLGTRNFFNRRFQRCQKVPMCISNPKKDMPDIIYSPGTNKCRDMEKTITKNDLEYIEAGIPQKSCDENYLSSMNINCHFGKFNNLTGQCDCFEGWTSATIEKDRVPASGLFVYHMCNVESNDWYDTDARKLKLICLVVSILAIILAMLVILCSFLIQLCYNCIKSFDTCATTVKKDRNKDKGKHKKGKGKKSQESQCDTKKQCKHNKGNQSPKSSKSSPTPPSSKSSRSQSQTTTANTSSDATNTKSSSKSSRNKKR